MVTYMALYQVLEYQDVGQHSPFQDWFGSIDAQAAAKVNVALIRLAQGKLSNVKALGAGFWSTA
jgi:putative component of toxin-antitoxin plasmid stabilization module